MSMRQLHDLSRVYLESVATKPDYLDFDKDGNKKEPMKKALKDKEKVTEAVRGQDTEMRKAASQERQAERKAKGGNAPKIPGREGPSAGKSYADYQQVSMKAHDKATRGKYIPGMVKNEALDPVGREDADIDNDGDTDKSDKYLHKRRKAIGKALSIRKESFSNWRQDLAEVIDKPESDTKENKQIKEKKNINNKIVINPEFKEAVEELGGVLLETVELDEAVYGGEKKEPKDNRMTVTAADKKANTKAYQLYKAGHKSYKAAAHLKNEEVEVEEGYKPIDREKESAMYRRAGNLARTSLSSRGKKKEEAQTKSSKIVSAITRQKEKERFDRIGQSPAHNEEYQVDEGMHRDVKTGEIVSKAVPGKTYYPAQPMKKSSVAIEKEKRMKNEEFEQIDEKCWPGYKKKGMKTMFGKRYPNCVKKEEVEFDEGVDKKTFLANRKKAQRAAATADARKRGHEGSEWHNTGRTYSADAAKKSRTGLTDKERSERHGVARDPDSPEGYSADKTKNPKKLRKQKAMGEAYIDEKTLTPAETKKKEEIVKSMKKSAGDFEKRYPGRGKEVMYATATKMAKKVAEESELLDERRKEEKVAGTPREKTDRAYQMVKQSIRKMSGTPAGQQKKKPGQKPPRAGDYGGPLSPAQRVAIRRASAQRSKDMISSRFD